MSIKSRLTTTAALAAFALAAGSVAARADIVSALSGAPTAVGNGYFAYTYNVQLTGGQLDATNGSTTSPTPLQFGTVYDFGPMQLNPDGTVNYSATGVLGSSFVFNFANTSTPMASGTSVNDNPALANIRFTYDGTTDYVVSGQTTTKTSPTVLAPSNNNLGTFTVYSTIGSAVATVLPNYDGQTFKGSNDTIQGNNGEVAVPTAPAAVPEPASLAIIGAGLVGMGLMRRRRRSAV